MEQNIDIAKRNNKKIYPIYQAVAHNLLFYIAISFLFLTQVKGIPGSMVMYADALYTVFMVILQIPLNILVEKIGKKKGVVIGNSFICLSILVVMLASRGLDIVVSNFLLAIGFGLKGMCEPNILYESVVTKDGKSSFASIEAKGISYYFWVSAITTAMAGGMYSINPYFPVVMTLVASIISFILSFRFVEIKKEEIAFQNEDKKTAFSQYFKDLKLGFGYILKSQRLRALFLFGGIFTGIVQMTVTYRKSLLQDLGVSPYYIGIVFALITVVSAIATNFQDKLHKKFRNKTLKVIAIPIIISYIVIGIVYILKIKTEIVVMISVLLFALQKGMVAPYWTLNKKYLTNFTKSSIRVKIFSSYAMAEGIGRSFLMFLGGILLQYFNTSISYLIIGVVSLIVLLFIFDYMRPRFGLKPEEYSKKDIEFVELK